MIEKQKLENTENINDYISNISAITFGGGLRGRS